MRQSRYTVVVDKPVGYEGEHLLYNTANGAFASVDDEAYASYRDCAGPFAPDLLEAGFLTELSADEELLAQKSYFDAQRADTTELGLVLAPTYACNLRCPYCYEQGHNAIKGTMGDEVMAAICRFVEERFEAAPFERLAVQWYGGDPSLALDVVETLSEQLIRFCDERDVEYGAMMLTNCNLIDEDSVRMLVRARVQSVYVTIDGFEETHNARRVSAVGVNSFEKNIEAVTLFVKYGIQVKAAMNVDRVNWPEFHPLREWLRDKTGVELQCARLCDYGHFFGTRAFKKPAFDLFTHEEFCRLGHEEFAAGGFDAALLASLLSPVPRFCNGQRERYYVIDTIGDVYACDGVIGEKDHVIFNLLDLLGNDALDNGSGADGTAGTSVAAASGETRGECASPLLAISHNPHDSEQCRACHLLPICQGNCDWERRATGMQCHPLLTMLPDYLRDYRSCFDAGVARTGHLQRFA